MVKIDDLYIRIVKAMRYEVYIVINFQEKKQIGTYDVKFQAQRIARDWSLFFGGVKIEEDF